jgi:hypothetical protein
MHPVLDPSLGRSEVRYLLSRLPPYAQGPHDAVEHDPLHWPVTDEGRKLGDHVAGQRVSLAAQWQNRQITLARKRPAPHPARALARLR